MSEKNLVIIPTYNMASFLPEAVESVVNNTIQQAIEIYIVDDGSTEPLIRSKLLNELNIQADEQKDGGIRLLEISHGGKSKAVNRGVTAASGQLLTILDADDELPSDSISNRVEAIKQSGADLCIGSFEVNYQNRITTLRSVERLAGRSNNQLIHKILSYFISPLHQNAMLFSMDLFKQVGGMNPRMIRGQDKDLAVRLLQKSKKTEFITDTVYIYHRYPRKFLKRVTNRLLGMKYKLQSIRIHLAGRKQMQLLVIGFIVEVVKLVHDFFGVYKR